MGTRSASDRDQTIVIKGFVADFALETLRDDSGKLVELRSQAFAVLRYLAENANRLISKRELMQEVWPGLAVTDDSLVQCVHEIRRALGDDQHAILKTIPRRGYRLLLPVESIPDAADSQRRMAAILAADAVGYSQLMGRDEEATLTTLKRYRSVLDALIGQHQGRIFGSAGDSVIAEFASPVEAVRCATEIQLEIDRLNARVPEASRMRFRIGINFGDVIADGDNILGDGVNVAARLEALSPPGGICISEAIHTHVRDRLSLDFLDLGEHKMKNIARPLRAYRVPLASEEPLNSPFRGLDAFDFAHADMFFGRSRAIANCIERLEQLAGNHRAFLLIYGMSGSGKSSLLRAGLIPAIIRPGETAGITLWRRCLIRPSEGADSIAALAAGLLREDALSELADEQTASEIADLLRSKPERAPALIRAGLSKAATTSELTTSQTRLVLAVDQMEELFTTQTDPTSREAFVRVLAALAASGLVWVIATIRADFFHRCSEIPGLSALKDGLGSYDLLPPSGPEIAQIIREPARASGVRFEESPDQGHLEDVLQEAAAADPGSLPLLEFVLDELYQAGRGRRLLTFAAYRALGGLAGAIARRADEVIEGLPPDVQAALPSVLRALTTVRPGDEAVTANPAKLADVAGSEAGSVLINALVAARLLVGDENAGGEAIVRVAHEALLSRWPRARDIVRANRSFLEMRARLQADARRWSLDHNNPELLLPAGKRLAEGEEVLQSRREEVDDQVVRFIEASSLSQTAKAEKERQAERARIEAEEAAKRERLEREAERRSLKAEAATRLAQRTRYAALVALALAVIAGFGAIAGFRGQYEASRQALRAEDNAEQAKSAEMKALEARDQALRNQSLSLSLLAKQTAETGDTAGAILLALEALPKNTSTMDRPYLPEAEAALYGALLRHQQVIVFSQEYGIRDAAFSPTGDRIVTCGTDKMARVWSVKDGSVIAVLKGHQGVVQSAMFSPDGIRVVTAADDGTSRIWNATSGEQINVLHQAGAGRSAVYSPDGTHLVTTSEQGSSAVWNAQTGEKIASVAGTGTTLLAANGTALPSFSPDSRFFVMGEPGGVSIWRTEDGRQVRSWQTFPADAVFSPDGNRVLSTEWNGASHLWEVAGGTEIAALFGFRGDTTYGAFSHDGRLAATFSLDGAAKLWDGTTGTLRRVLGEETGLTAAYETVNGAFSHDDRLLAVASLNGRIRIWETETGSQVGSLQEHSAVAELRFSPSDHRLLSVLDDGTARLWDLDGVLTTTLSHRTPPTFAAFSADDQRLVTGGTGDVAHVWDLTAGREVDLKNRDGSQLEDATFSPDGHSLATASRLGSVVLWDIESGRESGRLDGHNSAVVRILFSPDGALLASTSVDGTVRLSEVSSSAELAVLKAGNFHNALFSPDGKLVLTALDDNTARLWKTDGTEFRIFAGHKNRISAAAFSPDGWMVATGSLDGTARLWSIEDGSTVRVLRGHEGALTDIAFSRDGQSIVTASRDHTARIWNVVDGTEARVLKGHGGGLSQAGFSPNGRYALTVSAQDGTVRLWATESGQEIAILAERGETDKGKPAITRAAFSRDGTEIAIVFGDKSARVVRVFPTPQELIDYARRMVPSDQTACEWRRFFLPQNGGTSECPP